MSNSVFDTHDGLALAELVRNKEVTPLELLEEAIKRTEAADAVLSFIADKYYDFAHNQITQGLPEGPFTGVPFLRKDFGADIEGLSNTGGVKVLQHNKSTATSELAKRYLNAGLVFFGSTKVPPLAASVDTDISWYGPCGNPWDSKRTPGGSSSGAGSVVGAGVLPMAHGNDGGGSLRIPASWCGCFTVKPSRGRIPMGPPSTEGWFGFSTEGTITRSVRDCAAMMDATMGIEPGGRYTAPAPPRSYLEETRHDCRSLRIAVMDKAYSGQPFHPDCAEGLAKTISILESLGHEIEFSAPKLDYERQQKILMSAIAIDIAQFYESMKDESGKPVPTGNIETLMHSYAQRGASLRALDAQEINNYAMELSLLAHNFMQDYDVFLSPTLPVPAPLIGEAHKNAHDIDLFCEDTGAWADMTLVANFTGQPAMSVPLHWSADDLPIGMMFTASYGDESTLFSLAAQLEKARPWWNKKPIAFS